MENNQMNQKQKAQDERKTVLNGKVVQLNQAQQMEEQFNMQNNQTGVQAHHDNSSESVQPGEVAKNSQVQAQQEQLNIKQANVQSGQQYMGQMSAELQQTHEQQKQQAEHDALQKSVDAKAKTNKKG